MKSKIQKAIYSLAATAICVGCSNETTTLTISGEKGWSEAIENVESIEIKDGEAKSSQKESLFSSKIYSFKDKMKPQMATFTQGDMWNNWQGIKPVTTNEMMDAPIFIPVKEGDYWMLARKHDTSPKYAAENRKKYSDDELGYQAWHSSDMKTWECFGPVTGYVERWVTTAEYKDGKFYIYYDEPNDEDPHLIIDSDLSDGKIGEKMGMVINDPSHGSDCAALRDEDGTFHVIFENWDYNDARSQSWDAPVAGHAVSKNGIDFEILDHFIVDERTPSTGKKSTFLHPYLPMPGEDFTVMEYEVREEGQEAFGDWTAIKIGGQYYLFGDYDPHGRKIRTGRFTSNDINSTFEFCGELGLGHPDPTVGFAEGQFWLIQQKKGSSQDFVSPGPWVDGVEARIGVDKDGDGTIDTWSNWSAIKESYKQKEGFARIVERTPATLDLASLPAGYGFAFEYRTSSVTSQEALVDMKGVEILFK